MSNTYVEQQGKRFVAVFRFIKNHGGKKMSLDLDTTPLYLEFKKSFLDFCAEKQVSAKNINMVFEQVVKQLASNLGLDVKIEPERPVGLEIMLKGRDEKFLTMARR